MIRHQVITFTQWIKQVKVPFPWRSACCCWAAENFPCGFDLQYKYLDSGYTRPPVLKKGLGLFHFFWLKLIILQKLFKIFRNAKHLCFNALSDRGTMMDTISFMSWLPDDYSITALQESFPYYAKKSQNSQCFTIYKEYKQRQTKYSFFYFSNEANNNIDRAMLENSRASNSRVFIGVLSKFPKLKTSIFPIAGQPFIRWIRVIRSEQLEPEL